MNILELLERRHSEMLIWLEVRPAVGPEGNALQAYVEMRATVHDCVNMQRLKAQEAGRSTIGNDERFLWDFIQVHKISETVDSSESEAYSHAKMLEDLLVCNGIVPFDAVDSPEEYDRYSTANGISNVAKEFKKLLNNTYVHSRNKD